MREEKSLTQTVYFIGCGEGTQVNRTAYLDLKYDESDRNWGLQYVSSHVAQPATLPFNFPLLEKSRHLITFLFYF